MPERTLASAAAAPGLFSSIQSSISSENVIAPWVRDCTKPDNART